MTRKDNLLAPQLPVDANAEAFIRQGDAPSSRREREQMTSINIKIPNDWVRELNIRLAEDGMTKQRLGIEAIRRYLGK